MEDNSTYEQIILAWYDNNNRKPYKENQLGMNYQDRKLAVPNPTPLP